MEGDDDDDIQVVYENCNNVEWKAAREDLKIQYKKVVQSSGKCHPSSNDKSAHSGYRGYQNLRQSSGDDFIDSRLSSSTTSETEASNTGTDGIPLSVKMELIDAINGEESSSSVELLQDDSDSTISIEAETRNGDSMPRTEYAEVGTLFSCKENLSDSDEEYYETAQSRNSTISETCSADQGSNRTSTPATSSRKNGLVMQSPSAPTAAQIWREAHRSSMSTCSTDSEYSSQLQYFEAESGSIASSFVGGVDRMRIGDDDCRFPSRTPRPISHDEVSSTSDLFEKQVTGMDDELALAARWAEDHDLRIDDGDEFLECEDEDPPTPRGAPTNSKESRRTEERSNRKTGSPNKYRCRSHKRTSSLPKASDRDKTAKSQVDHRNATKPFSATRESRENIRKRNSSPILRRRSSSRSRGQERKRFASDRSHEKRRERRQPHCRESSPRPNRTRTSVAGQRLSATSALKAHNLPRYKPVDRRYDFTRWIDSNGELVLHKVKDVATGLVSAPLGCTYDSALDTFVFTRHDSILFSTSDGRILDNLTLVGFDQPCAICILRPGAAMGILDRSNLYLYEPKLNRLSIIASNLAARHRALTYNCNGDLITVKKFGVQLSATIFDATEHNRIIGSFVFPLSDGASAAINERQPCFADSSGSQMFFTDLRTNTLTCMEMVGNRMERIYSRCMQQLPAHRGEEALKRFVFMSGIRCDDFGHLLVADAKTHTLKLLTTSGQMLKCARFANGASFPYCSSFGVSPSGMLMACDRGNNRMVLFRIGEESISEDAVITDDVFDRMIGTSGVENEINRLKERARRGR
ncbi:hypothetical protein GCK32_004250 [Trichostrongylus colubriformis]|uniref:Uncharacterized protein n=1 Tax=Trichostrongylus colubriformis TaxID=6319 RepID=A0AAN8FP40_TRICO